MQDIYFDAFPSFLLYFQFRFSRIFFFWMSETNKAENFLTIWPFHFLKNTGNIFECLIKIFLPFLAVGLRISILRLSGKKHELKESFRKLSIKRVFPKLIFFKTWYLTLGFVCLYGCLLEVFVSLMDMDSGDSMVDSKGKGKKMEKKERKTSAGESFIGQYYHRKILLFSLWSLDFIDRITPW